MFIRKIDCLHMQDKLDRLCPMSRAKNELKKISFNSFCLRHCLNEPNLEKKNEMNLRKKS